MVCFNVLKGTPRAYRLLLTALFCWCFLSSGWAAEDSASLPTTPAGELKEKQKTEPKQKLDIGADYRLRGISFMNPTYSSEPPVGEGKTISQRYYTHRARIYLKGSLNPKIEIGTVLQAIGVSGSTQPIANRYPKEDFTPFLENIYLKANEINEWPVNATFGRQPYVWGSGLLLSDDGLGFDGISLEAGPFWGIRAHLFGSKVVESVTGDADKNFYLAGLSYQWGIHHIRLGWLNERDKSATTYSNLQDTAPVKSDELNRTFYNLNVNGKLEKGAFYNFDFALQSGKAKVPGKEFNLGGSVLSFEGGFDYLHPRYKRMILAFIFMQGSGDNPETKDADEKFNPSFGRKFDGLERVGAGDFFAATPYSFFNEEKVRIPLTASGRIVGERSYSSIYSGLQTFGFRGSIHPWESLILGLEFYLYNAQEVTKQSAVNVDPNQKGLGRELVLSSAYTYAKRIHLALRWSNFTANSILNGQGSSRVLFEVSGKF